MEDGHGYSDTHMYVDVDRDADGSTNQDAVEDKQVQERGDEDDVEMTEGGAIHDLPITSLPSTTKAYWSE